MSIDFEISRKLRRMDRKGYDYQFISKHSCAQKIGVRDFTIHQLEPDSSGYPDFSAFLSFCSSLIRRNDIVIITSHSADPCDFRTYGFAKDSDFFLYELMESNELTKFYFGNLGTSREQKKLVRCVQALADSINRDCMVIPLLYQELSRVLQWQGDFGFVVASEEVCSFLCATAGLELSRVLHGTSLEVMNDFSAFSYLWASPLSRQNLLELGEQQEQDCLFHISLGECLGGLHTNRILPDAHLGNFLWDGENERVVLVDRDDPAQKNYLRNLSPLECATNLVTLLAAFTPYQWGWFKLGYLHRRGEPGSHVIQAIEGSSLDPWEIYLDAGRYFEALEPLLAARKRSNHRRIENLPALHANTGLCFSKIGEYKAAVDAYKRALKALNQSDNDSAMAIQFNLAKTYYRMGNFTKAIKGFEEIRAKRGHVTFLPDTLYFETLYCLSVAYEATNQEERYIKTVDELIEFVEEKGIGNIRADFDVEAVLNTIKLTRSIKLNPDDVTSIFARAKVFIQREDYLQALRDLNRALELDPNNAQIIATRGEVYKKMELYELAESDLSRVLDLDPDNVHYIIARSELYEEMSRPEQALGDLTRAIRCEPDNVTLLVKRSKIAQETKQYEMALADLARASELESANTEHLAIRSSILWQLKRYEDAIAELSRAIALESKNTSYLRIEQQGDVADQGVKLPDVIKLPPRNLALYFDARASIFFEMEHYEDAIADWTSAIELASGNARYFCLRSMAYQEIGQYDKAIEDLNQSIEIEPSDSDTFFQRGNMYRMKRDYQKALGDYDQSIALGSTEWIVLLASGENLLQMGEPEKALAMLNRVIELNPDSDRDWALYKRSLVYKLLNQEPNALTDLNSAIKMARNTHQETPQNWRNTFNLALYLLALGEQEETLSLYDEGISHKAPIQRRREAISDVDDFLFLFPGHPLAQSIRNLLYSSIQTAEM